MMTEGQISDEQQRAIETLKDLAAKYKWSDDRLEEAIQAMLVALANKSDSQPGQGDAQPEPEVEAGQAQQQEEVRKWTIAEVMDELYQINFKGNIIPSAWYTHLVKKGNQKAGRARRKPKPYLVAITLLSEIVWWYRPREVRDELTDTVVGLEKKFKADKLQLSYSALGERLGLVRSQVKAGLEFLRDRGVITLEWRTIPGPAGPLSNVLFIGIDPDRLREITRLEASSETS